ncbi:MAG: hypothetical protein JNM17_23960 [Archangium sp.]|nr:hypothetical protein [Archangium sp.]
MTDHLTPGARKGSAVFAIVGTIWGVIALVASFFLAGEGDTPGEFFISRQALWNGGTYYLKFTFLMTLFTLFDVVGVPLIIISGVSGLLKGASSTADVIAEPPPSWDLTQASRRVKQLGLFAVLTIFWAGFTGLALFSPQTLKPIGFLASLLLILVPTLPLFLPAVLFDALIPIRYVEGVVESVQIVTRGNNSTANVQLAGELLHMPPDRVAGITKGVRAAALVSGFFGTVIRFEKRV